MLKNIASSMLMMTLLSACSGQSFSNDFDMSKEAEVIGGEKVDIVNPIAKSTVAVFDDQSGDLCTGVLISEELVLTAAHCVAPGTLSTYIYFVDNIKDANSYNSKYVINSKRNDDYKSGAGITDAGDLALLRISGPLPVGYAPVSFYPDMDKIKANDDIIVAGYGLSWSWGVKSGAGQLRTTTLKVRDPKAGRTELVLNQSLKKGVCSGDSGGPAYIQKDGKLYLVAITSRSGSYDVVGAPKCSVTSTFTRVDSYVGWIKKTSDLLMSNDRRY